MNRSFETLLLILLGLAGIVLFAARHDEVHPAAALDLSVDRTQAERIARQYLRDHNHDRGTLEMFGVAVENSTRLRQADLPPTAYEHVPFAWWTVVFLDPERRPVEVRIRPDGTVFTVSLPERTEEPGARLSTAEASALARTFARDQLGVPLERWSAEDSVTVERPARTDHSFRWAREVAAADTARLELEVTVRGDQIESWSRTVDFDTGAVRHNLSGDAAIFSLLQGSLAVLVWLVSLIVFALRFRAREIGTRNGIVLALLLMVGFAITQFNSLDVTLVDTTSNSDFQLARIIITVSLALSAVFTGMAAFFVWNSGESVAREVWPQKLATADALLRGRGFLKPVGVGIFRGLTLTGMMLGFWTLAVWGVGALGWARPAISPTDQVILSAVVPFLVPISLSVAGVILSVAYGYLFTLAFVKLKLRRTWLAVIVTALIYGTVFGEITVLDSRAVMAAIAVPTGLIAYLFFLRYDLWSTAVGVLSANVILPSALLLSQDNTGMVAAGYTGLGLLVALSAFGLLAILRGRPLEAESVTPTYARFITERERMRLELDIARRAQLRMLPHSVPRHDVLDIAAFSQPALEVGGDYYDFFELDENRLGVVIGDVSGKGMSAALYMTMLKGYLQSRTDTDPSPAGVLAHINDKFGLTADRDVFATMIYGVLDLATLQFRFARAGHCPLLVRKADGTLLVLKPTGLGVGIERGDLFRKVIEEQVVQLAPGDTFLLYSDGLPEARSGQALAEFGDERVMELLKPAPSTAEDVLRRIRTALAAFVGSREYHDDVTCVVFRIR